MKTYDAVILGSGLAGLTPALELARKKLRILILERDDPGGATSRAAAGILDPYTEANAPSPFLGLGQRALEFYPPFLESLREDSPEQVEFQKTGLLSLAFRDEEREILERRFSWQKKEGLSVESLLPPEILKKEPMVSKRVTGGLFYPEVSKLNAGRLTELVLRSVRSAGVEIRDHVPAAELRIEKGKVRGVRAGSLSIESPVVICAAGCWTGGVKKLGLKTKVTAVRGQILILKSTPALYPKSVLHSLRYAYVVPWPEGRLLAGSTLEKDVFDARVTGEGQEEILNGVGEISEGLRRLPVERRWAGLRPLAGKGEPVIGPGAVSGLYLAAGYYRSGILISPLAGKLLAEGIVSGVFSPLLKPFFPK